jgi:hypothetical protein
MQDSINELYMRGYRESREKVISEVNRQIFELAESKGVSVYDICFNYMPREKFFGVKKEDSNNTLRYTVQSDIDLVPIHFEFEKGGGYWKDKYFRLKENLQKIIDNKNE